MNQRIRELAPYPMVELARRKQDRLDRGLPVWDFGTGDPIEPTAARIRQAFRDGQPEVSQYPSVAGGRPLRQAFATWFEGRFGVGLDVDDGILPCRGSKEAMFHLPLVLVDPSAARRTVLYPVPGYPVMEIGSLYAGADTHEYGLDVGNRYLMDPAAVPAGVLDRCAIVWISYPHNPTGTMLPAELFEAWVEAQRRHGFVLCSDECYTELWFGDEKPHSLLEFGLDHCLAFHSLSKRSGMTGYRSAMVCGDPALVREYRRCRAAMGQAMPAPTEAASVAAWTDEDHVEERRTVFRAKRTLMLEGLAELGIEAWPNEATFYLWLRVPGGETDRGYVARLLEAGIVASPGSFFGAGNEQWFRLALVPDLEGCRQALAAWPRAR